MNEPSRILIVRLSAVGDVVHGLPVLCALRERFPNARIGWVVEEIAAPVLEKHPALTTLHVVKRKWLKNPGEVLRLRAELQAQQYEVALDLQGLTKSGMALWLSNAPRRIGFEGPSAREVSAWFTTERVFPRKIHVIDRNLELLRPLGVDSPSVRFNLPIHPEALDQADALLKQIDVRTPYAVINPGAGWPSKRWPPERFAAVARHLVAKHGLAVVVTWYGDTESALADGIVARAAEATKAPPTDLSILIALLKRARLCIGSDTGPLHLAAAVTTPCVGLYGPMPKERNGPYGEMHESIQKARFEGTSRARRKAGPDVMNAITVDDVCTACDHLLARTSSC